MGVGGREGRDSGEARDRGLVTSIPDLVVSSQLL